MGQTPGESRVVKQTFTVYAPVLRSPLNLDVQVEKVKTAIESTGSWQVTSFAVRSGDQFRTIPLLPKFLQPTVQIMKFVIRRRDGRVATKLQAEAVVVAAATRQAVTLESVTDWVVELKEEVFDPSIPTPPRICELVKKTTGLSCTAWGVLAGVGVAAVFVVPIILQTALQVGTARVVTRAVGSAPPRSRRSRSYSAR